MNKAAASESKLVKWSAILCLASILFALVVMVLGAWHGEDDDVPEVYIYLGSAACLSFTLSAIFGFICWVVHASSRS